MNEIQEIKRLAAPANMPQSLAWDGDSIWMGSMETETVYQIEIDSWKVVWETKAPGIPFGMTFINEELRVLCGETKEDNRIIRRCIPGHGFDTQFHIPCPDDTGSQLGFDGENLNVSQWYNQQVHTLNRQGGVERTIKAPHGICGQVWVDGNIYLAMTDDEETNEYFLTRLDLSSDEPKAEDIAKIPFPARALAFDGQNFWTNHRAAHEMVCFTA